MKKIEIGLAGLLIMALSAVPAGAWSHANRYGGSSRFFNPPVFSMASHAWLIASAGPE